MNGRIEALFKNKTVVYLDTAPIIYLIQEDPKYFPLVKIIFEKIDQGYVSAISSFLTLIEVLEKPLEHKDYALARQYTDLMTQSSCFTLYPVERTVAEKAAELRAKYRQFKQVVNFPTPDAIQIATAISFDAQLLITNDRQYKNVKELEVLVLDDLL